MQKLRTENKNMKMVNEKQGDIKAVIIERQFT